VFVGCGYGIGRTGTFLAGLCKLSQDVRYLLRDVDLSARDADYDAVRDVRERYLPHAVETREQRAFVDRLDVRPLARRIARKQKPWVVFDKRYWGF